MASKLIPVTLVSDGTTQYISEAKIYHVAEEGAGAKVIYKNINVLEEAVVTETVAAIVALGANLVALTDENAKAFAIHHERIIDIIDEAGAGKLYIEMQSGKRWINIVELQAAVVAAVNAL